LSLDNGLDAWSDFENNDSGTGDESVFKTLEGLTMEQANLYLSPNSGFDNKCLVYSSPDLFMLLSVPCEHEASAICVKTCKNILLLMDSG
jgi:hypothetical protein